MSAKVAAKPASDVKPKTAVLAESKEMILKPRISEKAYFLSQTANTYVFEVPKDANKLQVALALTAQFNVAVKDVNITVIKGKAKRSYRKRAGWTNGRRVDTKRAYVTLMKGSSLPIFAAEEDKEKKAAKAAKKDKK